MKLIKKKLIRILFSFIVLIYCSPILAIASASVNKIKESGVIKMSTNAEFPPFEYWENGEVVGIDVDISKKIAQKLGCELKIEDGSFDALLIGLANNNCDFVAAGLTPTPERARSVDFSEEYFNGSQVIIVQNNSNIKGKNDLLNKKVGVQTGTTSEEYCRNCGLNIDVQCFNKSADAVQDLLSDQLNAVIVDNFAAQKLVKVNLNKLKVLEEALTNEPSCIAVKKGNKELLSSINGCIKELKDTGELTEIIDKYYDIGVEKNYANLKNKDLFSKYKEYIPYILKGLTNTLIMTSVASLIGIILGIFAAFLKILSDNKNLKFLKYIANIYTTVIRGTPVVVQLFILYYGILSLFKIDKIICASLAFGINSGAYVAEHIRSGIRSIDKGQMEAGLSLGLSKNNVLRYIILPQSVRNVLPSLFGEFITLLRETAVVGYIGVMDLSKAGDIIKSRTYEALGPLFIVALIYLALSMILTKLLSLLEKKLYQKRVIH